MIYLKYKVTIVRLDKLWDKNLNIDQAKIKMLAFHVKNS